MTAHVEPLVKRSSTLQEAILTTLARTGTDGSTRANLAVAFAALSLEHWQAVRILVESSAHSSAAAMLRVQYESTTRCCWVHFAAYDQWIARFLSGDGAGMKETAPQRSIDEMIGDLRKSGPPTLASQLEEFKKYSWSPLNSFIHGGIHPVARTLGDFPPTQLATIVKFSNALAMMSAMVCIQLSRDVTLSGILRSLQLTFADCFPERAG